MSKLNWDLDGLTNSDGPPTIVAYDGKTEVCWCYQPTGYDHWKVIFNDQYALSEVELNFWFPDYKSAKKVCDLIFKLGNYKGSHYKQINKPRTLHRTL